MTWLVFYICYSTVGWLIRLVMVAVVLRRQLAPGASLAWLGIVFLHPYIGGGLYLLVGERRLGPRRAAEHRKIVAQFRDPARHPERQVLPDTHAPYQCMVTQAEKIGGLPALGGNSVEFFPVAARFVDGLVADIAGAKSSVHLLYYIFACDPVAERVCDAVMAAAGRGVKCRVLADAMASRVFFHRHRLGATLKAAGVEVVAALPVAPFRRRFARMDLRNHRKLAIIDDEIAWTGSHNLTSSDYGGRRGNPWVDVTGRFMGPIVRELASVFAEDWAFETDVELEVREQNAAGEASGPAVTDVWAQVSPTGPTMPGINYRRLLLSAIQCAQRSLVITTPYFVPDEPTVMAILIAADRGVDVKLILPQQVDTLLPAAAGRAHFQRLLEGGISIYLYQPGLMHAKTMTIDDEFSLFGTANLDVRSFELNFELSVLLYGQQVTRALRKIQMDFLAESLKVEEAEWCKRPILRQYTDRAVSLLSPLL
jgi:cardiolipin synthase